MNFRDNPFQALADRAKHGDAAARTLLHKRLEPQLAHMVRRTLSLGSGRTKLERQILAAAHRLGLEQQSAAAENRDFVLSVARSVCSQVVDALRPGSAGAPLMAETVRDC